MKINAFFVFLSSLFMCLTSCGKVTSSNHEHTFSSAWSHDHVYHWHDSTCGHDVIQEKEHHSYNEWSIEKEPTYISDGRKIRTCTVCGYTDTYKLDKIVPPYNTDGNKTEKQFGIEITELPYFNNGLTIMSVEQKDSDTLKFTIKNETGKATSGSVRSRVYYKTYDSNGVVVVSNYEFLDQMEAGESNYFEISYYKYSPAVIKFGTIEVQTQKGDNYFSPNEDAPMSKYCGILMNTLPYTNNGLTIMSVEQKDSDTLKFTIKNETGKATSGSVRSRVYYKTYDSNGVVVVSNYEFLDQMEAGESNYFEISYYKYSPAVIKFGTIEVRH